MSEDLHTDLAVDLTKITRLEVIDNTGRAWVGGQPYDTLPLEIKASIQDDGRTLKLFVKRNR